jgi:hypothetical protein
MPVHQFVHDRACSRGPAQLLGLQHDRLLRAARRVRARGQGRWRRSRSSRSWCGAARSRHRGDPRRRLQPHRRGQPPRPDAVASAGIDNAAYYRLVPDDPTAYVDYTGTGNSLEHAPPARAAADHGQPAVLGRGDARRRLPLRPRRDARPRAARRRPAVGVLRPDPAGPGGQPGEADRRAVGRRRGRLPGRQLPAAVVRVERPYRDCVRDFWRGEQASLGEFAYRPHRQRRPLRGDGRRKPHASINFVTATTASRCATWSPTTTSTTRPTARTTATASRQPLVELRGRGPDRRPRGARPARASSAT